MWRGGVENAPDTDESWSIANLLGISTANAAEADNESGYQGVPTRSTRIFEE